MEPFDLIIAPFRVMQNLERDDQIAGLMRGIRKHLSPGGEAILNTFCPRGDPASLMARWAAMDGAQPTSTAREGDETVTVTQNCSRYADDPLRVFTRIVYRRYDAEGNRIDESVLDIVKRVWYPADLLRLIEMHGFVVTGQWGGYNKEPWAEGSELVVAFRQV